MRTLRQSRRPGQALTQNDGGPGQVSLSLDVGRVGASNLIGSGKALTELFACSRPIVECLQHLSQIHDVDHDLALQAGVGGRGRGERRIECHRLSLHLESDLQVGHAGRWLAVAIHQREIAVGDSEPSRTSRWFQPDASNGSSRATAFCSCSMLASERPLKYRTYP